MPAVLPETTPLRIRPAVAGDAAVIADFNRCLARETEHRELDPARVAAGVAAVLIDPAKGRYLVAEADGRVVGQLMLTFEWSDWRNGCFWWIQSVYVEAAHRGRGVFTRLYRHVERLAHEDAGVCGLRLYMEHHNAPARAVYEKMGMKAAGYEVFEADFVLTSTAPPP